jgi:hypothetical protein
MRTVGLLRDAGLFDVVPAPPAPAAELPLSPDGYETPVGPTLAE